MKYCSEKCCACSFFSEMNKEEFAYAHEFFNAHRSHYSKGEFLHRAGEVLQSFGIVMAGKVQVCVDDIEGNQCIMAAVEECGSFGESLSYFKNKSEVYIVALTDCDILWLDPGRVKLPSKSPMDAHLCDMFVALLARRSLDLNDRIQILSKISLREKLTCYFTQCYNRCKNRELVLPFNRNALAVYLGANRSALCRELSRMQKEGIIEYKGNNICLKKLEAMEE